MLLAIFLARVGSVRAFLMILWCPRWLNHISRQALEEATRQVPQAIPEELVAAAKASTAIYHVNMSVFRSAPDTWAIGQVLDRYL